MTKRHLEIKREITDKWVAILGDMVETGKLLAILEVEDDNTTAIKAKKLIFKHSEDLRQFNRDVIEPIRSSIERYSDYSRKKDTDNGMQ